jgi:hypothetical protein
MTSYSAIDLSRNVEQFQQKCAAVLRPELRKNNKIEHFRDLEKSGNALGGEAICHTGHARVQPAFPTTGRRAACGVENAGYQASCILQTQNFRASCSMMTRPLSGG